MSISDRSAAAIPVARRVHGFTYAIRNIVAEAKKVEATGRTVRYLNIGDPMPFGFHTPAHLIEAVEKAHAATATTATGRRPASSTAREAVADDFTARGVPMTVDRVVLTSGTSEGIEIALNALVESGRRGAGADADVPALHRGHGQDRRDRPSTTAPTRPAAGCRTSTRSGRSSRRRPGRWSSSTRTIRPARSIRSRFAAS